MHSLFLFHEVFQAADIIFFPGIRPGIVLRHVALIGGDVKAVLALWGMTDTVLVHPGKNSAETRRIWDAESHFNKGAEIEMAVRVRGIGPKGYRSGKAFRREGVQEFSGLEL